MRWQHLLWTLCFFGLGCHEQSAPAPVASAPTPIPPTAPASSKAPQLREADPSPTLYFKALISPSSPPPQWPSVDEFIAKLKEPSSRSVVLCKSVVYQPPKPGEACALAPQTPERNPVTLLVLQGNELYALSHLYPLTQKRTDETYNLATPQPIKLTPHHVSWSDAEGCQITCAGSRPTPLLAGASRESAAYVQALLEHDEPFYTKNAQTSSRNKYQELSSRVDLDKARRSYPRARCSRDTSPYMALLSKAALSAKHGKTSWQLQLLSKAISNRRAGDEVYEQLEGVVDIPTFMLGHVVIDEPQLPYSIEDHIVDSWRLFKHHEHKQQLMIRAKALLELASLDPLNEYVLLGLFTLWSRDEGDEAAAAQAKKLLSELKLSNPQLAPLFGLEAKPQ